MVISHTDDQSPFRDRAAELGVRTAFEADDHGYEICQLHPGDTRRRTHRICGVDFLL